MENTKIRKRLFVSPLQKFPIPIFQIILFPFLVFYGFIPFSETQVYPLIENQSVAIICWCESSPCPVKGSSLDEVSPCCFWMFTNSWMRRILQLLQDNKDNKDVLLRFGKEVMSLPQVPLEWLPKWYFNRINPARLSALAALGIQCSHSIL